MKRFVPQPVYKSRVPDIQAKKIEELTDSLDTANETINKLEQEISELHDNLNSAEEDIENALERGHDECTRGVLDYMRLVQGGMLPIEAASIVQHSHDLDQELIDEMYRFQMPELKLTLPKPAKKPKRKK